MEETNYDRDARLASEEIHKFRLTNENFKAALLDSMTKLMRCARDHERLLLRETISSVVDEMTTATRKPSRRKRKPPRTARCSDDDGGPSHADDDFVMSWGAPEGTYT